MIMLAQFGLELDGNTALPFMVAAPFLTISSIIGVSALRIPSGLIPSTPITTTCLIPVGLFLILESHENRRNTDKMAHTINLDILLVIKCKGCP
jgi:hypothetical protein